PLVLTGLDKMEEMIIGPMTRLDQRTALHVPGQAVRIARAFRHDLELPGARMHPPKRTVELIFPATVGTDAALIEDAVQTVQPSVWAPRERVGQLVRVRAAKPCQHHFATGFFAS